MTIFCKITHLLVDLIIEKSEGHLIVDCGAGEGALGAALLRRGIQIISLDCYPPEETLSNVFQKDAIYYRLPEGGEYVLAFLRPCHGASTKYGSCGWVDDAIVAHFERGAKLALYISLPKNLEIDLDPWSDDYRFDAEPVPDWVGEDGERMWIVHNSLVKQEREEDPLREFVRWSPVAKGYGLKVEDVEDAETGWAEVKTVAGEERAVNAAGGYCLLDRSMVVETLHIHGDFEDLDWSKTYVARRGEGAGWISPTGEWFECPREGHDAYARLILRTTVRKIERSHVRVYGPPYTDSYPGRRPQWVCINHRGLTQEQARRLRRLGHEVKSEDIAGG